ncbi:MAG: choice-of-anchor B family protein [Actinobacteria bacterium]|nr:choice-of-anchor B family protein [Actinomycetota bacterium]
MKPSKKSSRAAAVPFVVAALVVALTTPAAAHPEGPSHHAPAPPHATEVMKAFAADQQEPASLEATGSATCTDGFAAGYPCSNVDLLAFLPLSDIGGTRSNSAANDIWGWTDTASGKEYAIVGRVFGTSFVDISDPSNPVYLGELPTHGAFGSSWRDIKVYADHAFIVSEALNHGMQVFDLTQLRNVTSPPVTFAETAYYSSVGSAHNVAINEASGFAYVVGASGKNSCSGGLHMVDIRTPTSPSFAGCFSADGYTHDTQCVIYAGPDAARDGREICFNSNEDTVTIVDVTDKATPLMLARVGYAGSGYTHQGWLTDDQTYFLLDDELDERNLGHNTRTRVWDVSDLDAPTLVGSFDGATTAIDHNQYVQGRFSYQANYRAGLRILELVDVTTANLSEVGYFDVYPTDDKADFNGAWSNYPYFASGVVVVSGIEQGLFVLRPNLATTGSPPTATDIATNTDEDTSVIVTLSGSDAETCELGFSIVSGPAHGSLSSLDNAACISGTPNTDAAAIAYTPDADYNGPDSFAYRVTDEHGNSGDASVSITVAPENDAPIASNDSASTTKNTSVTVDVLANDSDIDGDTLSVTEVTNVNSGATVTINEDNTLTYTPPTDFVGPDAFGYTVSDGNGGTDSAAVEMSVTEAFILHVGDLDGASVSEGSTWNALVTVEVHDSNDALVDGATVSFSWRTERGSEGDATCDTGATGRCTVSVNGLPKRDGSVTFTVTGVTKTDYAYDGTANHDLDGDSDGTSITVRKQ